MAKAMEPFRDLQAHYWFFGPGTDVPDENPSHRPWEP